MRRHLRLSGCFSPPGRRQSGPGSSIRLRVPVERTETARFGTSPGGDPTERFFEGLASCGEEPLLRNTSLSKGEIPSRSGVRTFWARPPKPTLSRRSIAWSSTATTSTTSITGSGWEVNPARAVLRGPMAGMRGGLDPLLNPVEVVGPNDTKCSPSLGRLESVR